jgi:hypothetical protein
MTTQGVAGNKDSMGWRYYRYHVPDPIYFKNDCKVTLQQIAGNRKDLVSALQKKGIPLIRWVLTTPKKSPSPV